MRRMFCTLSILAAMLGFAVGMARADAVPRFQPEPFWPKPLPGNWILGQVSGIAVGPNDRIWVLHRPKSLLDDEKGATKNPPENKCCTAGAGGDGVRRRGQSAPSLGRPRPGL